MPLQISTERLLLEDLAGRDLGNIRRISRDRETMQYVLLPWLEDDSGISEFLDRAVAEAEKPDRRLFGFAIRIPATGEFAGITMIEIDDGQPGSAEAGCILLPPYWRNGYAPEILKALLAFAFGSLGLDRVYAKCDELNVPSARAIEKCGLRYEGTLREHVWLRDHWRSSRYYSMLDREYVPVPAPAPVSPDSPEGDVNHRPAEPR